MKKYLSILLAAVMLFSMLAACAAPVETPDATAAAVTEPAATTAPTDPAATAAPTEPAAIEPELQELTTPPEMVRYYLEVPVSSIQSGKAIAPLNVSRTLPAAQAEDGIQPYDELGYLHVSTDLSNNPALAYSLTFSNTTTFEKMPTGFDPNSLLQWGMSPGLNVDILHKHGFTGKGAVIAYVDQAIADHPAYANVNLHYTDISSENDSMHGPTVLSMLAGKDIGTAPEAEVYYYAHPGTDDAAPLAEALYAIIEQNKSLPEGEKITMVGFSNNMNRGRPNEQQFTDAVAACKKAGIMVWFCGEYAVASFLPYSNKNNPANVVKDLRYGTWSPSLVHVPGAGRTSANQNNTYTYRSSGGLSWTMPYILGLYAMAIEIDPTLTQDDIRALVKETAYETNGMKLVNPVGLVTKVLQNVGHNDEAQAILDDVAARTKYLYAVVNTSAMTNADLNAVRNYLSLMTDVAVLIVDAAYFGSAEQLYTALQKDAKERGGEIAGVQIFGTADLVPAFSIGNKVQMIDDVHDAGTFLSDLFYSNFENDPARISKGYNVMDHFAEGWEVDLIPRWPVARLPLSRGEFSAYFEKYNAFLKITGLQRPDLVNFSNPIFKQTVHTDDMGTFLNRMNDEFELLDIPYRLYGNKLGQYPVTTATHGGFTAEELAAENDAGIAEFLINSHGQWNNIDKCYFENGKEIRESLINMSTINTVLSENPYYLDIWSCDSGYNMRNNLTTTALNGQCVGMFSATTGISNNGTNCNASLSKMAQSNFYYFYYHYLKALHEGKTRGTSFFTAQAAYATALISHSANGIQGERNYQFNLCNLLTYHNFGVLEPGFAATSFTTFDPIVFAIEPEDRRAEVHNITTQTLENGYTRFFIEYTALPGLHICVFSAEHEDTVKFFLGVSSGDREYCYFDISDDILQSLDGKLIINFFSNDDDSTIILLDIAAALKNQTGAPEDLQSVVKTAEVHSIKIEELDNSKTRFEVEFTAPKGTTVELTSMLSGSIYAVFATGERETLTYDVSTKQLPYLKALKVKFSTPYGFAPVLVDLYPQKIK